MIHVIDTQADNASPATLDLISQIAQHVEATHHLLVIGQRWFVELAQVYPQLRVHHVACAPTASLRVRHALRTWAKANREALQNVTCVGWSPRAWGHAMSAFKRQAPALRGVAVRTHVWGDREQQDWARAKIQHVVALHESLALDADANTTVILPAIDPNSVPVVERDTLRHRLGLADTDRLSTHLSPRQDTPDAHGFAVAGCLAGISHSPRDLEAHRVLLHPDQAQYSKALSHHERIGQGARIMPCNELAPWTILPACDAGMSHSYTLAAAWSQALNVPIVGSGPGASVSIESADPCRLTDALLSLWERTSPPPVTPTLYQSPGDAFARAWGTVLCSCSA